ncbi:MAG: MFS transporter [Pseudoxanthomonas sp.]
MWLALAYALPVLPYAMLATPALSIVPPVYAKHGAISLAAVSMALLIARTFDAVIDPAIGMLADRMRRIVGYRGWILAAMLLAVVAGYFWLQVDETAGFGHFLGWSLCLCLAWSLFEIPHRALLAEMARTPDLQAMLAAWRTGMSRLGMLACLLILQGAGETSLVTPATLRVLAAIVVPLLLITGTVFLLGTANLTGTPDEASQRNARTDAGAASHHHGHVSRDAPAVGKALRLPSLIRNPASRRLLTVSLFMGGATGMTSALYFLYMDSLLGIADRIPAIALTAIGAGLVGAWLWLPVITRIGDIRTLAIGNLGLATIVAMFCIVTPSVFPVAAVTAIFVASALVAAGMEISQVSLAASIVRQHQAETGQDRAASFFSLERFVTQIGIAVGAAAAMLWVNAAGFRMNGGNDAWISAMFLVAFAVAPALLHLAAGLHILGLVRWMAGTSNLHL